MRIYTLCPPEVQNKGLLSIDFKTELVQKLHKQVIDNTGVNKGEPKESIYYRDAAVDPTTGFVTYGYPVCRIDWTFYRDPLGFVLRTVKLLRWYKDDGTLSEEYKDLGRIYDPIKHKAERMDEVVVRRTRIVESLMLDVSGLLIQLVFPKQDPVSTLQLGRNFLQNHNKSLSMYRHDANMKILEDVDKDPTPWLDITVGAGFTFRSYIIDALKLT